MFSVETLRWSMSNPVTGKPVSEYNKARGNPTYPKPIIATRAWRCWILVFSSEKCVVEIVGLLIMMIMWDFAQILTCRFLLPKLQQAALLASFITYVTAT